MSTFENEPVVADAVAVGFECVHYETDTGQAVWEWRRGSEPGPQFVTRGLAVDWMTDLLAGTPAETGSRQAV